MGFELPDQRVKVGGISMKQKRRGTVSLVCGIICIVFCIFSLALGLVFGEDLMEKQDMLMNLVWIAFGIYFCYIGIKMRKNGD